MNPLIELTGQHFGLLTVMKYSPRKTKGSGTYWVCTCKCGRTLIVRSDNLRSGRTSQCSLCKKHGGRQSVFCEEGGEYYGVV